MSTVWKSSVARQFLCLLILGVYAWMMDLKGITTDEGFRLWIINGGQPAQPSGPSPDATWDRVIAASDPYAYQPLYFLIQNAFMRLADTQSLWFFRSVNILFLWLALQGLLALSREWRPAAQLFMLGLFSCNAYLFMHVLQIREYIAGVAFYIWTTWLILRLDARRLDRPWSDTAYFASYGLVLVAGFYLQSWTVFPAAAQGLFLILRRPGERLRHYSYLALSYVIAVTAIWPYLQGNQQKVSIGLWATDSEPVQTHLFNGFHLVLSGHLPGVSRLTDGLFWVWLIVLAGGLLWFFVSRTDATEPLPLRELRRQATLMLLCIAFSVSFQIGYALKVENLSLWPRYFIIHYFFLVWLIALVFHHLLDCFASERRGAVFGVGVMTVALAISAVFQVFSFRNDPMLDTSQSLHSNWRVWAAGLAAELQAEDAVLMDHFISQATLTFTRPFSNRMVLPDDLVQADLTQVRRLVTLADPENQAELLKLASRAAAAGFGIMHRKPLMAADGLTNLREYQLIIFCRAPDA